MRAAKVLEEAQRIITGARRKAYGKASTSFRRVAIVWAQILGVNISARQVALCMVVFKVIRDANRPGRDNMVDVCGYGSLAEDCPTKKERAIK